MNNCPVPQRQKAVTAYLKSERLLPFDFALQFSQSIDKIGVDDDIKKCVPALANVSISIAKLVHIIFKVTGPTAPELE